MSERDRALLGESTIESKSDRSASDKAFFDDLINQNSDLSMSTSEQDQIAKASRTPRMATPNEMTSESCISSVEYPSSETPSFGEPFYTESAQRDSVLDCSLENNEICPNVESVPHFAQMTKAFEQKARQTKGGRMSTILRVTPDTKQLGGAAGSGSRRVDRRSWIRPALPQEWLTMSSESPQAKQTSSYGPPSPGPPSSGHPSSGPSYMTPTRAALNRRAKMLHPVSSKTDLSSYAKARDPDMTERTIRGVLAKGRQSPQFQKHNRVSFLQEAKVAANGRLSPEREALIRLALHRRGLLKLSDLRYPERTLMPMCRPLFPTWTQAEDDPFVETVQVNAARKTKPFSKVGQTCFSSPSTTSTELHVVTSPKRSLSFIAGTEAFDFTVTKQEDVDAPKQCIPEDKAPKSDIRPLKATAQSFNPVAQPRSPRQASSVFASEPPFLQNNGPQANDRSANEEVAWYDIAHYYMSQDIAHQAVDTRTSTTTWNAADHGLIQPSYQYGNETAWQPRPDIRMASLPGPCEASPWLTGSYNMPATTQWARFGRSWQRAKGSAPRWRWGDGREVRYNSSLPPRELDPNYSTSPAKDKYLMSDSTVLPRSQRQWAEWLQQKKGLFATPLVY